MDNVNRYLIVRDSHGEVQTEAYFASDPMEAMARATELTTERGGRWLVCIVLGEGEPICVAEDRAWREGRQDEFYAGLGEAHQANTPTPGVAQP